MKKIIYIVSILFVAIVITTIAYALFDFNHENLIIIFFSSLISIIITEYVRKVINDVNVQDSILKILHDNMVIDWYKRENIQSKMKITVASEMSNKMSDKDKTKKIADDIVSYLVNEYFEVSKISK